MIWSSLARHVEDTHGQLAHREWLALQAAEQPSLAQRDLLATAAARYRAALERIRDAALLELAILDMEAQEAREALPPVPQPPPKAAGKISSSMHG